MEQLNLSFEPGTSRRHADLTECCATSIYRIGLGRVAQQIDLAPSNLSAALAGQRKFGVDDLERYLDRFPNDLEPVYYLIDKYLRQQPDKASVLAQAETLLGQVTAMVAELKDA